MKIGQYSDKSILLLCFINISVFYLSLMWQITGNLDRVITEGLFYGVILYILWRRRYKIKLKYNLFSSFIGAILIAIVIIKSLNLFTFENKLIFLVPFLTTIGLVLIISGFSGILRYSKELFLTGVLFFPEEVIGMVLEKFISVTVLNAKIAAYILYYFGFNVATKGNEVLLYLPKIGNFQAIVNYSCSGMPMIILLLKLTFALIILFPFGIKQRILIPILSVITGFTLGVIRVCILTLLIPQPTNFDYWHGNDGSQIFSTVAIILFCGFAYWLVQKQGFLKGEHSREHLTTN